MNRIGNKKDLPLKIIIMILLVTFAVIQLYPLFWLLFYSLKDNAEILGGNILGLPKKWLFSNYKNAFVNGNTGLYFMNSTIVTSITVLTVIMTGGMISFALTRMNWKLSKPVMVLIIMGMMIPGHVALLPLFVLLTKSGLFNTYWALIIPYIGYGLPFTVIIFMSFLEGIPRDFEEAACIDGCNIYSIYFKIIMPMLRPAIATVAIFTFLGSWNELMFAITFITKTPYKTITVGIQSLASQYNTQWGPIGAGLVVASAPTVILYTFASKQVQNSLTVGGLKG